MQACVDAVRTTWPQPPPGCLGPRLVLCGLAWVPPTARLTCRIIVAPEDSGATARLPLYTGAERSGARVPTRWPRRVRCYPIAMMIHESEQPRRERSRPARRTVGVTHDCLRALCA